MPENRNQMRNEIKKGEKSNHVAFIKSTNKELHRGIDKAKREDQKRHRDLLISIAQSAEIPADILRGISIITMTGRNMVRIENFKKILAYSEEYIEIQMSRYRTTVEGKRLKIEYYSQIDMKISGIIDKISYNK